MFHEINNNAFQREKKSNKIRMDWKMLEQNRHMNSSFFILLAFVANYTSLSL